MIYPKIPTYALVLALYGKPILLFLAFVLGVIFIPAREAFWMDLLLLVCYFSIGFMLGSYGMKFIFYLRDSKK